MDNKLKIAIWNVNGLHQRLLELKTFLSINKIDVMLVVETHLTNKNYMKISFYNIYATNRPTVKARGGTAIIIKCNYVIMTSNFNSTHEHTSYFSNNQHNTIQTYAGCSLLPIKAENFSTPIHKLLSKSEEKIHCRWRFQRQARLWF